MRKHTRIGQALGVATLVAGALAAGAAQAQYSGNVVKVGVLTDMSGVYSDVGGQGSIEAAKMAIADFGGKVNGIPVEVVSADHQNKADVASSKSREWVDQQGVDMITDILNSAAGIAVAKLTKEKPFISMNVGAATVALTNAECTPYSIHWAYDTYALANGTAAAIVKQGGKSWFMLTADYAFGHQLEADTEAVVKAGGGEIKGKVRHPLSASDFSSFLLQAQASKAQIVGLANAGHDTSNSIKAAAEFGLTKNQKLAGLLVFLSDIHSLGLNTAQGMLLTDGWYWDYNDETRAFGRRYFEKMKRMPTMVQAGVYSTVTNYLKAVQQAKTDDRDKVMAVLKSMKINDVFAKNGYVREDGRMVHDMYLMEVKKPADSKYPWDYYTVKAVIPGEQAFKPLSQSTCSLVKK